MNQTDEIEFQFLKEKLQEYVKEYLELDEEIKVLAKASKDRKDRKKDLSNNILDTMKQFNISQMNTKDGKLSYNIRNNKVPLNKVNITKTLTSYFKNETQASEICKYILENRETVEKISLKRTKVKIQNN